jgi:hypothetical protein
MTIINARNESSGTKFIWNIICDEGTGFVAGFGFWTGCDRQTEFEIPVYNGASL